ncbi:MAG TPA: NifU family protein [Solirubrobacteraceae bacterium]|nr:NifU family protein [Solirubrobacteraceae bacterium]
MNPDELLERIQQLTAELDVQPDSRARELAQELVSAVLAIYGDGLERILDTIGRSREGGAAILDELSQDGAVSSLLLIHDLYPASLEERVLQALDTVRPYMESHGGNVELLELKDGVARLALQGSCNGCAASRATLELAIKQALEEHAPDLNGLEVEGITDPAPGGFELPVVHSGTSEPPVARSGPSALPDHFGPFELPMAGAQAPRWTALTAGSAAPPGGLRTVEVDGVELLLANVAGSLLAYRNACAACGDPLDGGTLEQGILACPRCGVAFDLPRAGRAVGGEPLQLAPVPLLQSGGVRVAVAG